MDNPVEKVQNRMFARFFHPREISGNVTKKFIDTEKPLIQGEKLSLSIFLWKVTFGKYMQNSSQVPHTNTV